MISITTKKGILENSTDVSVAVDNTVVYIGIVSNETLKEILSDLSDDINDVLKTL